MHYFIAHSRDIFNSWMKRCQWHFHLISQCPLHPLWNFVCSPETKLIFNVVVYVSQICYGTLLKTPALTFVILPSTVLMNPKVKRTISHQTIRMLQVSHRDCRKIGSTLFVNRSSSLQNAIVENFRVRYGPSKFWVNDKIWCRSGVLSNEPLNLLFP